MVRLESSSQAWLGIRPSVSPGASLLVRLAESLRRRVLQRPVETLSRATRAAVGAGMKTRSLLSVDEIRAPVIVNGTNPRLTELDWRCPLDESY